MPLYFVKEISFKLNSQKKERHKREKDYSLQ